MKLATHLHLVPRLRMSGVMPLFPVYACMVWRRATYLFFTFTYEFAGQTI
jgi:hypothetical protein